MTEVWNGESGTEPIVGADEWIAEIVRRSKCSEEEVRQVLAAESVRPPTGWHTGRHTLEVRGVHFAGIKQLREAPPTPFSFASAIGPGVSGFGTHDVNDAGKSSFLHIILWAIRGRTDIQDDVKRWLRGVLVEIAVDGERMACVFSVHNRRPRGTVWLLAPDAALPWGDLRQSSHDIVRSAFESSGSATVSTPELTERINSILRPHVQHELASFSSGGDMERVMDGIMTSRLGFETIPSWAARRDSDRIDESDGALGRQGWATWSGALLISDPSIKVVLGEETFAAARLLQVYLGSPWAPVAATAQAYGRHLENRISVLNRQAEQARSAHSGSLESLRQEIEQINADLASLSPVADPVRLGQLAAELQQASVSYADANALWLERSQAYGSTAKLLESAEADHMAITEAAHTRRFWHSLKPTCCPRCETDVTPERWADEKAGRCSLCASDLGLPTVPEKAPEAPSPEDLHQLVSAGESINLDSLDDLTQTRLAILQLHEALSRESTALDDAKAQRDQAAAVLASTRSKLDGIDTSTAERRMALQLRRAEIGGQLSERQGAKIALFTKQVDVLRKRLKIVTAAEKASVERRGADQGDLLAKVNEQLTAIGQHLGVAQLTGAELDGGCRMAVTKGGATVPFSKVNVGQRLRLKIAVVAALLRVGQEAGVTRHPGLLILDSVGREETNPAHVARMLEALLELTREIPGLQVIVTSAHGTYLTEALGPERTYLAEPGSTLW
ncbi:hypothetical protein J7F02_18465 [Streptomyces sp. ISL-112]|uniref:hypothetical protein n=1 Tax=unclassified Streptomyces TaxID=2593676 RepID=UPI001BE90C49|nr:MULTISPECIES: hypothetical protein [unclassified Streptomyces]MBT2427595.1 hypothetical protein [Streptomyces sp. ISL-112]MBT2462653.1 hypothetical protein [Streptomyces sp. ISL-63]